MKKNTNTRHSYVRFFPSDWMGGTARMSRLHRSVYLDVCVYNWDKNAAVPAGELVLMLSDLPDGMRYVEDLIAAGKLTRCSDGSVANPRAMAEAKAAFDLWDRKSKGGKTQAAKLNAGEQQQAQVDDTSSAPSRSPDKSPAIEPEPEPEPEGLGADAPKPTRKRAVVEAAPAYAPPQPEWSEFVEFRKRIRKPLTPKAVQLNLAQLDRLASEGHDPRRVIEQSIEKGWASFYPLEGNRYGRAGKDERSSLMSAADQISPGIWGDGPVPSGADADAEVSGSLTGGAGGSEQPALPSPSGSGSEGASGGGRPGNARRFQ